MGRCRVEAATEETIVESAGAHLAAGEREGTRRRGTGAHRLHHRDAIATVSAPGPPALVIRTLVLPVAVPPLMMSLSDGESSVPRNVRRRGAAGAHVVVDGQRPEFPCRKAETGRHRSRIGDGVNTVPVLPRVPPGSTLTGDNSEPVRLMAPSEIVVRPV